jgi:beta-glucosidase/6-phospho-beta-glucosidase/beta-galactosidase
MMIIAGGWLNASAADWFEEYARLCFTEFGNEVKFWITLNEPKESSIQGIPFKEQLIFLKQESHNCILVYTGYRM